MCAKLWGNITVREGHVNRLSAHNKYKHRSLYTCRTDFEDIREDFNEQMIMSWSSRMSRNLYKEKIF